MIFTTLIEVDHEAPDLITAGYSAASLARRARNVTHGVRDVRVIRVREAETVEAHRLILDGDES